jgi:hypothetical protein
MQDGSVPIYHECMLGLRLFALTALAMHAVLAASPALTFHKDIEPILRARCQGCHRPGEVAPMPLLRYQDARPWAKAIRAEAAGR